MFRPLSLIAAICFYVTALFLIALWVERRSPFAQRLARNPYTYSLALAVYCTSWTFYGSVGSAASEGPLFLTIYLGPTLAIVLWGVLLRKMVRLKNLHRISSIADLISARYGKSQRLAALATAVAVIGTMPYLALQLRAISSTFRVIAGPGAEGSWLAAHVGTIVIALMIVFTIVFGARRLDPTERHEGLLLALAVECVVKLVAFVTVGLFVTFFLADGPQDLFDRIARHQARDFMAWKGGPLESLFMFGSFLVLAMSAIQFLPRQFHVAVVENSDERHVYTAMWLLPLYLLLINVFVIPIAGAALLTGVPHSQIDTFVLQLPLRAGNRALSLLVFLGGFSAATGMIIVEALALSTMVSNHWVLPVIESWRRLGLLRRSLLRIRWLAIASVLGAAFLFDQVLSRGYPLVQLGMISFAAVAQFAPVMLGGLFWRRGSERGAIWGLGGGFFVWGYTLLVPALIRGAGWSDELLQNGPLGLAFLRPEALFGVEGLHFLPHAAIWSLACNTTLYVIGSLLGKPDETEERMAESFVGILGAAPKSPHWEEDDDASIDLATKEPMIDGFLRRYFAAAEAIEIRHRCEAALGLAPQQRISVGALAALYGELERVLGGSIGAAAAHHAVRQGLQYTREESEKLPGVYARILANLKVSPADLKQRVDYYQERAIFLEAQAALLEARVQARTAELEDSNRQLQAEVQERKRAQQELSRSNAELEQFAYVASHDLQEPLRMIASYMQLIERRYKGKLDDDANDFIGYAVDGAKRMQSLINDLLLFARIGTRGKPFAPADCGTVVRTVLHDLRVSIEEAGAAVTVAALPTVNGDDVQLRQLFLNLIGNAIKFHSEAAPVVEIRADRLDGNGNEGSPEWRFVVADNGIGIDDRFFGQIFRLFHRLHTRAAYPGNGIGLALCKKIVERHEGRIWVESSPGRGTSFYFTIPDRKAVSE